MLKKKQAPQLLPALQPGRLEAGIDEAGRGCYAGPVVAAAVILPHDFFHPLLNDSKQIKPAGRYLLRTIIETHALAYAVAFVHPDVIDRVNILQATYMAMHAAVDQLHPKPAHLIVDGNRFKPYSGIAHTCVVGGDARYTAVAAASILAKTCRDDYMITQHQAYPHYDWQHNKGYGTAAHRDAIAQHGLCALHRKSFAIAPGQLRLALD